MPTEMPTPTKQQLLDRLLVLGTLKIQAVDSTNGYVSGTTHFLGDLVGGSFLGTPYALTTITTTDGFLRADPATIAGILTADPSIDALVVYVDTGSPATSPIVVFVDTNADNTDMNRDAATGENISAYPPDYIVRI
jgi:hypothetical protein